MNKPTTVQSPDTLRHSVTLLLLLVSLAVAATTGSTAAGDSVYERMTDLSLRGEGRRVLAERDKALRLLADNGQWEHYYFVASLCIAAKVLDEGQTMSGLRDCRKLYEFARDHHHEYGRGVVLAQMGWLYGYLGDHEESVRQLREAFRLLRRHAINRDAIGLLYYYAYALELTKRYDEEAAVLAVMKPLIRHYQWNDTSSIVYKTYSDNLLNAETLLEVRRGRLDEAAPLVDRLHAKLADNDEQNRYEALRAIAEYHKARGDYALALATTDRMQPLARNSGLRWGLTLLRTELLRLLGRSDEAYDQLRPMLDQRSMDRMGQLRQQLSEMETLTELDELRIHKEHMQFWYAVAIALVLLCGLGAFTIVRHRAAVKLKRANSQLHEAYDQLEATTTAKERIESELRIARDIQMSMLPGPLPPCDCLDVCGAMTPAREVGGDLYDLVLTDARRLYFCVGDVSGKGVPASLFMAQAIRLFRALAKLKVAPADMATYMNRELSDRNDSGMFVTMFIAMTDLTTGHLDFCNCGHNPPVIGCGTPQARFLDMESNAPIGLWPDMKYTGEAISDIRHQPLLVYTDGLNEAEDDQHRQLGDDRLLQTLQQTPFTTARQLLDDLQRLVADHRNGAEPNDDLTMLCLLTQ